MGPNCPSVPFTVLPDRSPRWRAFGASVGVQPVALFLLVWIPALLPQRLIAVTRYRVVTPSVQPVEIVSKAKPAYSVEARQLRLEGELLLEVTFTALSCRQWAFPLSLQVLAYHCPEQFASLTS